MPNLFLRRNNKIQSLLSKPFSSEEEFEELIFETPGILEDIFPLKRQIRGGHKKGLGGGEGRSPKTNTYLPLHIGHSSKVPVQGEP
jgi:hypothetical protein